MNKNYQSSHQLAINVLVFLFGLLILIVKNGYTAPILALGLIGLPRLFQKETYLLSREARLYCYAVLYYVAILLFSYFIDGEISGRDIEPLLLILATLSAFLLLYHNPPTFKVITYGILWGTIAAGVMATYEKFVLHSTRAFTKLGFTHIIQAGDISMSLGLICLTFAVYYHSKKDRIGTLLFILGSFCGIFASVLSGTRGGWVLLGAILLAFYFMFRHYFCRSTKLFALFALLFMLVVSLIPQVGVISRITSAKEDVSAYWKNENKDTSLGIRFQLWQSALHSFREKPLIGWGKTNLNRSKDDQLDQQIITPFIRNYNTHAHNEYLDEMAIRGLLGLSSLLTIFFMPLLLLRRKFKTTQIVETEFIAGAAIITILTVIDYCFSQSFFKHYSGLMFYFGSLAIFLGYCFSPQKNATDLHV